MRTSCVVGVVALLALVRCSDDGENGPRPDGPVTDGPPAFDQLAPGEQPPGDGPARDSLTAAS